jgi:hypothetical protein
LTERDDNHESWLRGYEFETWEEEHFLDLTSLAGHHAEKDVFSRFIDKIVGSGYHKLIGHKLIGHKFHDPVSVVEAWGSAGKRKPIINYPDKYLTPGVDTLSTIAASTLPTVAAFAIYFIHNQVYRMAAIVGCTFLFSATLTLIARPRRVEVFTASAAFAAVLVVFVGGSNGSGPGNVS